MQQDVRDAALAVGRNGERRVIRVRVGVSIAAIAEVARIIVVQKVGVAWVVIGFDWPGQGAQMVQDRRHTGLRTVGAIGVAAAAIDSGRCAVVAEASVAVLDPPVICARDRIGIFDFVHRATGKGHLIVRRNGGIAVGIAEPDGVAKTEDDAVETGAAHGWLVIVVAHREIIGEKLGVGGVALQNVVEAHGGRAFTRGHFAGRVIGAGRWGLGFSVYVGADSHLGPSEDISLAAAVGPFCYIIRIAIL